MEELTIPAGWCQCGCGRRTNIIPEHCPSRGEVKGAPRQYISGHQARKPGVPYEIRDCGYITPCWVWAREVASTGYGRLSVDGKSKFAHRHYFEMANGPIPKDKQIDHLCRNRACCNPDHLEAVPQAVNLRRGAHTKLTEEIVAYIRASDEPQHVLRRRFGVASSTVSRILSGEAWKPPPSGERVTVSGDLCAHCAPSIAEYGTQWDAVAAAQAVVHQAFEGAEKSLNRAAAPFVASITRIPCPTNPLEAAYA